MRACWAALPFLTIPLLLGSPVFADGPKVRVRIEGSRPGLRFRLERGRRADREHVAECDSDCTMWLAPGTYRLNVSGGPDTVAGTRTIDVLGRSTVHVEPRDSADRTTGGFLGMAGLMLAAGGVLGARVAGAGSSNGTDQALFGGAVVAALIGVILIPVGFAQLGRSAPEITVTPDRTEAARQPTVQLSPFVGPSGFGFGGQVTF